MKGEKDPGMEAKKGDSGQKRNLVISNWGSDGRTLPPTRDLISKAGKATDVSFLYRMW